MDYDKLVFIGRFSPFTNGHLHVIQRALALSKTVIVIVGSCFGVRDPRNPWTFEERKRMIVETIGEDLVRQGRLIVLGMPDFLYDDPAWLKYVQQLVAENSSPADKIGLIGHSKDNTSYYIKKFPAWGDSVNVENYQNINATDIRRPYFMAAPWAEQVGKYIPDATLKFMREFQQTEEYAYLLEQEKHIVNYPALWGKGPFLTADAVCLQAGHILLVKRGGEYGKGQLALPGGFMNPSETLLEAAIRELKEETRIDLPRGTIEGEFKASYTFDNPHRDLRARIITTAHLFNLDSAIERQAKSGKQIRMTKVKGSDDADEAMWVPLANVKRDSLFADHFHIINKMLTLQ